LSPPVFATTDPFPHGNIPDECSVRVTAITGRRQKILSPSQVGGVGCWGRRSPRRLCCLAAPSMVLENASFALQFAQTGLDTRAYSGPLNVSGCPYEQRPPRTTSGFIVKQFTASLRSFTRVAKVAVGTVLFPGVKRQLWSGLLVHGEGYAHGPRPEQRCQRAAPVACDRRLGIFSRPSRPSPIVCRTRFFNESDSRDAEPV